MGGRDGTRHQLDHGVRGRFVIVGETSGLHIVNESKGMLVVRLLATGRAAHAAYPWLGDNALVKLQRTVASLLAEDTRSLTEEVRANHREPRPRSGPRNRGRATRCPPTPRRCRTSVSRPATRDLSLAGPPPTVTAYLHGFSASRVTAGGRHPRPAVPRSIEDRPEVPQAPARGPAPGRSG